MKHILLTPLTLLGLVLIGLPHLPASVAGYFIPLTLLAVPFTLLLLSTTIALFIQKDPWRWIVALITLGSLNVLTHHWIHPQTPNTSSGTPLTLISWNVTNFHIHPDTLQKAAQYLRTLQPDLICLQEVPHNNLIAWDSIRAAFPEHPYTYKNQRDDEVLNLAILSKYPMSDPHTTYFHPGYNKMASARIQTPQGTLQLWNVHLQTTGSPAQYIPNAQARNRQAQQLKDSLRQSKYPTIVCGDFNDTPCSYAYRTLSRGMHDAYLQGSETFTGSYQPHGQWLRIDYTLCPKDWQVTHYQLIENPWSDHKIQLTTLCIPN